MRVVLPGEEDMQDRRSSGQVETKERPDPVLDQLRYKKVFYGHVHQLHGACMILVIYMEWCQVIGEIPSSLVTVTNPEHTTIMFV